MKPVVQLLRDRQSLAAIVRPWEDLAANALEGNPFYEPWMLLPALWARGDEDFECVARFMRRQRFGDELPDQRIELTKAAQRLGCEGPGKAFVSGIEQRCVDPFGGAGCDLILDMPRWRRRFKHW